MIRLKVADCARPTGRLLRDKLRELGLQVYLDPNPRVQAVVCYGYNDGGDDGLPTLNAGCGKKNGLTQLQTYKQKDVLCPNLVTREHLENKLPLSSFPMFARKLSHRAGKDLIPVFQQEEMQWRLDAGWDFFTSYVPMIDEFRVWSYRGRILGVYKKVMTHVENYTRLGRNYHNGFAFEFVPREKHLQFLNELAAKAVWSLGLDFGATDILLGKDERAYVLETNTAPGVTAETSVAMNNLCKKIVNWTVNGFKKQNTEWSGLRGD